MARLIFFILIIKIALVTSVYRTFDVQSVCKKEGSVAFCYNRLKGGVYQIQTKDIARIVFSRIDNHVTMVISKDNTPMLSSIIIKIGSCPLIQTDGSSQIFIEAANQKCIYEDFTTVKIIAPTTMDGTTNDHTTPEMYPKVSQDRAPTTMDGITNDHTTPETHPKVSQDIYTKARTHQEISDDISITPNNIKPSQSSTISQDIHTKVGAPQDISAITPNSQASTTSDTKGSTCCSSEQMQPVNDIGWQQLNDSIKVLLVGILGYILNRLGDVQFIMPNIQQHNQHVLAQPRHAAPNQPIALPNQPNQQPIPPGPQHIQQHNQHVLAQPRHAAPNQPIALPNQPNQQPIPPRPHPRHRYNLRPRRNQHQ